MCFSLLQRSSSLLARRYGLSTDVISAVYAAQSNVRCLVVNPERAGRFAPGVPASSATEHKQYSSASHPQVGGDLERVLLEEFPARQDGAVFCDGAAGTRTPRSVIRAITSHLEDVGCCNVGVGYSTVEAQVGTVTRAREACRDLLGASSADEITFGLNATNLLFHLSRSLNTGTFLRAGDNVVVSRACHESNVAPWLRLAQEVGGVDVRWLDTESGSDRLVSDAEHLNACIDDRTKVVAIGLASNATGRIHLDAIHRVAQTPPFQQRDLSKRPLMVLDGTHYVPHHHFDLSSSPADVVVCSAYKFCGPHVGVMGLKKERAAHLSHHYSVRPVKVGMRFAGQYPGVAGTHDVLDCGPHPTAEDGGCEVSAWEMGTLPYESLRGLSACAQDYLTNIGGYPAIVQKEMALSHRFLSGLSGLQSQEGGRRLQLHGSTQHDSTVRTPTFALTFQDATEDAGFLCRELNQRGIFCTAGNHYAVELVDKQLAQRGGVTRVSFLHYNSFEDVDRVLAALHDICTSHP